MMAKGVVAVDEALPPGMTDRNRFWQMRYHDGSRHSCALIASDGKRGIVLEHVGTALDYIDFVDSAVFRHETWDGVAPPGIWIWEGTLESTSYWTDCGQEYDEELVGQARPLTEDEWELYRLNGLPWDEREWGEPWQ